MVKLITTNLQSAIQCIHSTPKQHLHVILDTRWKDLVPLHARVRDPGIMTFQHVLKVNMKPQRPIFIQRATYCIAETCCLPLCISRQKDM